MKKGYKVVFSDEKNQKLLSAIVRQNPDIALEYRPNEDTVPSMGYAMVFGSRESAENFVRQMSDGIRLQVWLCEYEPAPVDRTKMIANWVSREHCRLFWNLVNNGLAKKAVECFGVFDTPAGTHFASSVRLIERMQLRQ